MSQTTADATVSQTTADATVSQTTAYATTSLSVEEQRRESIKSKYDELPSTATAEERMKILEQIFISWFENSYKFLFVCKIIIFSKRLSRFQSIWLDEMIEEQTCTCLVCYQLL